MLVWVRSFIEPDVLNTIVPFDNTTPIYLINLLWKLGLGFALRVALFLRYSRRIRKVSTLSSANFTKGNILLTESTHKIKITYSRSARA